MAVAEREEPIDTARGGRSKLRSMSKLTWVAVSLGILAVLGALIVLYATSLRPWAYSDGAGYVMLARNVLEGRGLGLMRASGAFQSLSMHPPLYSLTLVAIGLPGVEPLTAARWLDAVFFATTIALVGAIIYYVSRMVWLAGAAAAVILATPALVTLYTGTLSEPLYFVASLGGILLLLLHFQLGRAWMLIVAALLAGLSVVTRYLGVTFVAAGFIALLAFGRKELRLRVRDAVVFGVLGALPTVLWFVWMNSQASSASPRQWNWDFSNLWARTEPIRGGLVAEIWDWIPFANAIDAIPYRYQLGILVVIGGVLLAVLLLSARALSRNPQVHLREHPAWQLIGMMIAFNAVYLVVLSGVYLFGQPPLDAADIDQRILTPVYLSFLLTAFALVPLVRQAWPTTKWVVAVPALLVALTLAWYVPRSWDEAKKLHASSAGFTSQAWTNSETIELAGSLPEGISIISNESTALMFHLDRPAYDVPELLRAQPQEISLAFGDGQPGEERMFREEGAALVLFDSVFWQMRGVYGERAEERLEAMVGDLDLYADLSDGAIYFYPQP